jgi:hypothetical protein
MSAATISAPENAAKKNAFSIPSARDTGAANMAGR